MSPIRNTALPLSGRPPYGPIPHSGPGIQPGGCSDSSGAGPGARQWRPE